MSHEVLENGDILIRPTPPIRVRLWERDPCCCWCGFLFIHPDFATIEHLQFKSRGGKRTMDNCRLACGVKTVALNEWAGMKMRKAMHSRNQRRGQLAVEVHRAPRDKAGVATRPTR